MKLTILAMFAGALLLGAGLLGIGSRWARNRSNIRSLWKIYATQFAILAAIVIPSLLGPLAFTFAMMLISLIALEELLSVSAHSVPRWIKNVSTLLSIVVFVTAYQGQPNHLYALVPMFGFGILLLNIVMPSSSDTFPSLALAMFGLVYPCLFLAHAVLLQKMPNGFAVVLFMYGVSESHDSFALLCGKMWGKKKIFPQVSPNKTYVGFFSGILCAVLTAFALTWFIPMFTARETLIGAIVIIIGSLSGDLMASKLKRDLGVKDFGMVLPHQGGLLDIYDSLIVAAPLFYAYVRWIR